MNSVLRPVDNLGHIGRTYLENNNARYAANVRMLKTLDCSIKGQVKLYPYKLVRDNMKNAAVVPINHIILLAHNDPREQSLRKHFWKRRKCWFPAFSPIPNMFSTLP